MSLRLRARWRACRRFRRELTAGVAVTIGVFLGCAEVSGVWPL